MGLDGVTVNNDFIYSLSLKLPLFLPQSVSSPPIVVFLPLSLRKNAKNRLYAVLTRHLFAYLYFLREVVDLLEPHLRENFGDQSRKISTKESTLVFSGKGRLSLSLFCKVLHIDLCPADNQGHLKPNDPLPKNPERYTAVAPALPVSESFAASFLATAAFQPRNLQTIFLPSKQDVDLASIQQHFDDFNRRLSNSSKCLSYSRKKTINSKNLLF